MKKIAHIQLLPILSGVQRVSLQELALLENDRYKKYLICKENGPLSDASEKLNTKVFYIHSMVRNISPLKDFISLIKIFYICRKEKFDVVHTHSAKPGMLGRLAAKLAGVPMIVHTVHGFPFDSAKNIFFRKLYVFLEKIGAMCSDKIICLHENDRNLCRELLSIPAEKIFVIPNGVDLSIYHPVMVEEKHRLRKSINIPTDATVFIMVGRLWQQKNPLTFLLAAKEVILSKKIHNPYFLLVGDGPLIDELKTITSDECFNNRVVFTGWQSDISKYLSLSDVFVLPSLWEGMPLAILEAQSTGLPCLVSNISGNNSLVKNDFDGYLFEPNSHTDLAALMIKLEDKFLRTKLGYSAREKIVEHYDVNSRINLIKKLYSSDDL